MGAPSLHRYWPYYLNLTLTSHAALVALLLRREHVTANLRGIVGLGDQASEPSSGSANICLCSVKSLEESMAFVY